VTQRTGPGVGVSQVVRLRLEPSAAQVELLRGYCGTARAASNALLFRSGQTLVSARLRRRYCSGDHEVPVLEWTKGTALLPVLELLQDEDKRAEFMAAYGNALLSA